MGRTSKIDTQVKIQACERHLSDGRSFTSIANELGFNRSTIRNWVLVYISYGPQGFELRNKTAKHSNDLKEVVLKEYLSGESSAAVIAGKFNISGSTILRWIKKYYHDNDNHLSKSEGELVIMKYQQTTFEKRLEIVLWCLEYDNTYTEASKKFDVPESTIRSWIKKYHLNGAAGLKYKKRKRNEVIINENSLTELEKLRLELERERNLRKEKEFELDVLKKKEAFERKLRYQK